MTAQAIDALFALGHALCETVSIESESLRDGGWQYVIAIGRDTVASSESLCEAVRNALRLTIADADARARATFAEAGKLNGAVAIASKALDRATWENEP